MYTLQVGDSLADGSIEVIASDSLCYQVRTNSKGVAGVRTISRELLDKWTDALEEHPDATPEDIRDILRGTDDVDNFELGNRAPLHKLAHMRLHADEIVKHNHYSKTNIYDGEHKTANRSEVFSNIEEKFVDWLKSQGKDNTFAAANHYVENLRAIGEPVQEHTSLTGKWCGLYELLTGEKPAKGVFGIKGVAEFSSYYGEASLFFAIEKNALLVKEQIRTHYPNCKNFDELYDFAYTSERGDGGHTRKGYCKYCQFLCELESQVTEERDETQASPSINFPCHIDVGEQKEANIFAQDGAFKAFIDEFRAATATAGLMYDEGLVRRFVCALLSKSRPFVILTGLSGSGKTKLAEAFAKWMGTADTYKLVSVGADWTNSEKLLGFPNALDSGKYVSPDSGTLQLLRDAEQNPDIPFFLILDEMNLSHVECYFADFLSAMESTDGTIRLYDGGERKDENDLPLASSITFPKNLFVIGTMNVDETTHAFSPKVLDRAQVIEFRVSDGDLAGYLDAPKEWKPDALNGGGKQYGKAFLSLHENIPAMDAEGATTNRDAVAAALKAFFKPLSELGSEFGYRTASEIMRFCAYYLRAGDTNVVNAIDAAVMQKLLPKLHGSQARLMPTLKSLATLAKVEKEVTEGGETKKVKVPQYALTHEKVERMMTRLQANGFTSFAEA